MKLSDYKGEEAIELLADLIEPIGRIFEDKEALAAIRGATSTEVDEDGNPVVKKGAKLKAVKQILKAHSAEVLEIMALIDGEDVATYSPNFFALPNKLLELFNDDEFMNLFTSQGQNENDQPSGSATEITEGEETA